MRFLPLAISATAFITAVALIIWLKEPPTPTTPLTSTPAPTTTARPALTPELQTLLRATAPAGSSTPLDRELQSAIRAIHVRPSSSDCWLRLGDALVQRARDTLDVSLYAQIEQIYTQARQLDPQNIDALAGLAWAAAACHRFDNASTWARLGLQADPDLAAAHAILGDAALELGDYERAQHHYQRLLDLRPDMGAYSRAAHLLYIQGNAPRALALMRQALRAGGENPEHTAWSTAALASMLCREGAAPSAQQLVQRQLQHSPNNPLLLAADAQTRSALGDETGAITSYEKSAALAPQHTTLAALYDLYLANNRPADAARVFAQIEALHRDLLAKKIQGGEGQLAHFYADTGQNLPEAIRLAETEHHHHRTAFAADTLAWALFRAGRVDDAAKLLPEILRHRAPDPAMLYHAGLIEEALGRRADAQRHLSAALSRNPRFSPLHAPLAHTALQRLGSTVTVANASP
jgi:tetratricopeptide (TPR) repeat protein